MFDRWRNLARELGADLARRNNEYVRLMGDWAASCAKIEELEVENNKLSEMLLEAGYELLEKRPQTLNGYADMCRDAADNWWHDLETGEKLDRNKGELLMLIVSEVVEAFEAERKDLMDDHLPDRSGVEVELADALIRIFDYAGEYELDLDGAVEEKLSYNAQRADHKPENRRGENGKKW